MKDPLVTVLMPVRNGAKYLRDAIDSVLRQSFREFELLIIDDASEDETPALIKSYADSCIRCLRNNERLKLAGALNRGIAEARGRLIARMDADDICKPQRLERQVRYMERHADVDLCGSAVEPFGGGAGGRWNYPSGHDNIRVHMLFDNPFAHPTVMMRKSIFEDRCVGYDVAYYPAEDYALWSTLIDRHRVANIKDVLLMYRVHQASMTRADGSDMDRQSMRIMREMFDRAGIHCSDRDILVHRLGCTGRLPDGAAESGLRELGRWFLRLRTELIDSGRYSRWCIEHCIHHYWYSVCSRQAASASGIVEMYFNTAKQIRGCGFTHYGALFLAGALKRAVVNRGRQGGGCK